jgi:hypothetical protein
MGEILKPDGWPDEKHRTDAEPSYGCCDVIEENSMTKEPLFPVPGALQSRLPLILPLTEMSWSVFHFE